ncbi:hypothetical protein [Polynucleobacter necessarius]|uniref:hypothetical protein n=1 Tax=Polynucleobacter necessarius TaxID=576610 RepID=UPI001E622100|nr:hypothetical protein [Polynucleobacter necessarius]
MINAELKRGRTNEASTWLKARIRSQPNEIVWWSLLSKSYDQANNVPMRHYVLGEKYALEGAWPSAIEQLRIARAAGVADFYQGSSIDAHLREMQR